MLTKIKPLLTHCSCGATHSLVTDTVVIEKGAYQKAISYLQDKFSSQLGVLLCDEHTQPLAQTYLLKKLPLPCCVLSGGTHATEAAVESVNRFLRELPALPEYLIACGSGSIHDITRYVAFAHKIPFVSFPTAASVDGFVSNVAAMTWYGQKLTFPSAAPIALFADVDVFATAPKELTASGVGDIFGKYIALLDWKISSMLTKEPFCENIYQLEREAVQKMEIAVNNPHSDAYLQIVMECLVLSGLVIQLYGNSRPASGAEHHLSHFWEMHRINPDIPALHGEKVGVATLLVLERYQKEPFSQAFCLQEEKVYRKEAIQSIYQDLTNGILEENKEKSLKQIDPLQFQQQLPFIKAEIQKLPDVATMRAYLQKAGAKTTLHEIGLPNEPEFIRQTLHFAPYVRNRLTLLKIIETFH